MTLIALVRGDDFEIFTGAGAHSVRRRSPMSLDNTNGKLVRMANQIATFFKSQPEAERVAGVATHINKFWEPRMRKAFFELVERGDAGFDPIVISAAAIIKRPGSPSQPSGNAEHVDEAMQQAGFSD